MNSELTKRWQSGLLPFDGGVLALADEQTTDHLLTALRIAFALLFQAHGTRDLYVIEDWHDHDGFITPARRVSWAQAQSWIETPTKLLASCSDDWAVYTLLFPDDYSFCLRYWLDEDDECRFDLCAARGDLEPLANSLREAAVAAHFEPSAKAYFDRVSGA
jgi:hypothetical protein